MLSYHLAPYKQDALERIGKSFKYSPFFKLDLHYIGRISFNELLVKITVAKEYS